MDEQNIPIDINASKLLDWLISRRHVSKDWQNSVLKIREKINNAIQDMPAHDGIANLLNGQHINYFHCLKIIEILKETEADSKNLFGRYGSKRMKDWQDIVNSYQKDNIYLAEVSQILIRNISYEIPSLKKQITKLEQSETEVEKKIKDCNKSQQLAMKEFNTACEQLGIKGKNIKNELLTLLDELPEIYNSIADEVKIVQKAIVLYGEFIKYLSGKDTEEGLTMLKYLISNGNTTTYEYIHGQKPLKIELEETKPVSIEETSEEIDFGDEIDFSSVNVDNSNIDFGDIVVEDGGEIDWGTSNADEGFEIITHSDLDVNLEESGIVVEESGVDGGIARGEEALTILDNPNTREKIINDLLEIDSFLKLRVFELSTESDLLSISQMQDAPIALQMETLESVLSLSDNVNVALSRLLLNKRLQHLHNIKHSKNYIDVLTSNLKLKLSLAERMANKHKLLEDKLKETIEERSKVQPLVKVLIDRSKALQKEIEQDISKKYKGRIVNIVGGVNSLH